MIVIIAEKLALDRETGGRFELHPDFELLGRPYREVLASEYRRLGAREVFWLPGNGGHAAPPAALQSNHYTSRTYRLIDRSGLSRTAIARGEPVLVADMRLWPANDLRDACEEQRAKPELTLLAMPVNEDSYGEIIEPAERPGEWKVRRRYQQPPENSARRSVAFIISSGHFAGNLGELVDSIVEGGCNADSFVFENAEKTCRQIGHSAVWIDSLENYLAVAEKLLACNNIVRNMGARRLGEGVWALPGAEVDAACSISGPVLLGRNSRIGRGTRIVGPAHIGDNCDVGTGCFIGESIVQSGVAVSNCARIWHCVIGSNMKLEEGRDLSFALTHNSNASSNETPDSCSSARGNAARNIAAPARKDYCSVVVPPHHSSRRYLHLLTAAGKRAIDICGALVGLALTLPLYPFIALAIVIDNFGPVFYVDRRLTRGGKEFGCLKFRSMVRNAHEMQRKLPNQVDGPQFHLDNDPRLTRVGRLLRKTNLDEVPQFWNVLLGQMSLVGPRPSPDSEIQYCPAWREARLSVRAGLTGLWQIKRSSDRSQGDFHEWIHYDSEYVRNCSVKSDLKVLFDTCKQMIHRFI